MHPTKTGRRAAFCSFYDRPMPGRVVLLHGTSSSGKTNVARAVQRLSEEPWICFGIDFLWSAIDERWMEHGPFAADGFLWLEDASIVPGPLGQRLAAGMRAAVAAFARAGNYVLVDDVFVDDPPDEDELEKECAKRLFAFATPATALPSTPGRRAKRRGSIGLGK